MLPIGPLIRGACLPVVTGNRDFAELKRRGVAIGIPHATLINKTHLLTKRVPFCCLSMISLYSTWVTFLPTVSLFDSTLALATLPMLGELSNEDEASSLAGPTLPRHGEKTGGDRGGQSGTGPTERGTAEGTTGEGAAADWVAAEGAGGTELKSEDSNQRGQK